MTGISEVETGFLHFFSRSRHACRLCWPGGETLQEIEAIIGCCSVINRLLNTSIRWLRDCNRLLIWIIQASQRHLVDPHQLSICCFSFPPFLLALLLLTLRPLSSL